MTTERKVQMNSTLTLIAADLPNATDELTAGCDVCTCAVLFLCRRSAPCPTYSERWANLGSVEGSFGVPKKKKLSVQSDVWAMAALEGEQKFCSHRHVEILLKGETVHILKVLLLVAHTLVKAVEAWRITSDAIWFLYFPLPLQRLLPSFCFFVSPYNMRIGLHLCKYWICYRDRFCIVD